MTAATSTPETVKLQALQASVFGRLSARQLEDIARLSDIRRVAAGAEICVEGEFSQAAFVIADGQVSVVSGGVEVACFGAGNLVGDWALFGGGHRTATLRALTDVEVVVVDPREIDSLLMAVPEAAAQVGPHPSH